MTRRRGSGPYFQVLCLPERSHRDAGNRWLRALFYRLLGRATPQATP